MKFIAKYTNCTFILSLIERYLQKCKKYLAFWRILGYYSIWPVF